MPEPTLAEIYLGRLGDALPLPDAERSATVEEIASHVSEASSALIARGLPRDVAERRVLERLGAPERLAEDIAAAHRVPAQMLSAAGTALRVSLVTAFQAFVAGWAALLGLALVLGLALAGARWFLGSDFLQVEWWPLADGLLPAIVGALVAYAVGRAVSAPVALAVRRRPSEVRPALLVVGLVIFALVGLTAIEARWTPWTAALMATLPAWFVLGVVRPQLLPRLVLPRRALLAVVGIVLVGLVASVLFAGPASFSSSESQAYDPSLEFASVGPFVNVNDPPVVLVDDGSSSTGPWEGIGPVTVVRTGTIGPGFVDEWTSVRLEVWPGPAGQAIGPALDPAATEPLATAPMTIDGRRISGELRFEPLADRDHYYVTVTGLDADGERWQLGWPGVEVWHWRGTPLELLLAAWR